MSDKPDTIRVVLVDDHRLFRSGVRTEIDGARNGEIEVVGEAEDLVSGRDLIAKVEPDVVLLDVNLPDGEGASLVPHIDPKIRVLGLSVSDAAEDVIGMVRAGARGYVTKSISGEDLVDAICRVAEGDAVFSPKLAGFVLDAFSGVADVPAIDPELDLLSQREGEVMRLIARGYTYREAARDLHLSVKTIETHVSSVLRKLQLSNRRELSKWAAARRLV